MAGRARGAATRKGHPRTASPQLARNVKMGQGKGKGYGYEQFKGKGPNGQFEQYGQDHKGGAGQDCSFNGDQWGAGQDCSQGPMWTPPMQGQWQGHWQGKGGWTPWVPQSGFMEQGQKGWSNGNGQWSKKNNKGRGKNGTWTCRHCQCPVNPFSSSFCIHCGTGWKYNGQQGKGKGKGKGNGKGQEIVWGNGSVEGPGQKGGARYQPEHGSKPDEGQDEWVLVQARKYASWVNKKDEKGEGKAQQPSDDPGPGSRYAPLAEADEEPKIVEVKEDEIPSAVIKEHKLLLGTVTSLSQRLANAAETDKGGQISRTRVA